MIFILVVNNDYETSKLHGGSELWSAHMNLLNPC